MVVGGCRGMACALGLKPSVVLPSLHALSSVSTRSCARGLQQRCSSSCPSSSALRHTHTPRICANSATDGVATVETEQAFDESVYDAERLQLDSEARDQMAAELKQVEESGVLSSDGAAAEGDQKPGAWKWAIRKRIWDLLEAENVAKNPRPVHHRIPNFVGAEAAAAKLASLPEFVAAKAVKVNPDTPQKEVRRLVLDGGKKLITPQPRLRTGFFSLLDPSVLSPEAIKEAVTALGVAKHGVPLTLKAQLKVDFLVIGSVAVDPATGARLGKGEGFAELEYGLLRYMGAIDDSTLIVTSVHDKQLVNDIPKDKLLIHDVPVDVICTPTRIIRTNTTIPKPTGIYWDKLSPEKLSQIKVLRDLKRQIEAEKGEKLPTGPSETLPPLAERRTLGTPAGDVDLEKLQVWNIGEKITWIDLRRHIERLGGQVSGVTMFKQRDETEKQAARVTLKTGTLTSDKLVLTLRNSYLKGSLLKAKVMVKPTAEQPGEPKEQQPANGSATQVTTSSESGKVKGAPKQLQPANGSATEVTTPSDTGKVRKVKGAPKQQQPANGSATEVTTSKDTGKVKGAPKQRQPANGSATEVTASSDTGKVRKVKGATKQQQPANGEVTEVTTSSDTGKVQELPSTAPELGAEPSSKPAVPSAEQDSAPAVVATVASSEDV